MLQISQDQVGDVAVLTLEGKLIFGPECDSLNERIAKLNESGSANILVNIQKLVFIDSSGIGELIAGFTRVKKKGGTMKVAEPTDQVEGVFKLVRLPEVIEIYDSHDAALASFNA